MDRPGAAVSALSVSFAAALGLAIRVPPLCRPGLGRPRPAGTPTWDFGSAARSSPELGFDRS
jgi:hypothetical protein